MKKILFFIALFTICSFVGADDEISDVIRTKRLILVDSSGNERADLRTWEDGSVGLIISGKNKKSTILIGIDKDDNPSILIIDQDGQGVFYVPQKQIAQEKSKNNKRNATVRSFPEKLMKQKAEAEWPDNFQMQEFEIKTQKESYYFLQAYNPPIPTDIFSRIKKKAELEWPNNFQMQKFEMKNQVESYQAIK